MRFLLVGALLGISTAAVAQCPGDGCPTTNAIPAASTSVKCPGPGCPEKYEKPQIHMVAEKCPGPGCPEKHETAAAKPKKSAKPAKKAAEPKQDWGHFSSGAKKDQKAMEKQKAKKGGESSGG